MSKTADPPVEWSETKNIRWKVEIPGRGSASPVVWGDKVFVLSRGAGRHRAAPRRTRRRAAPQPRVPHKFVVIALDRKTGKDVWERTARESAPHEGSHPQSGTYASSSAMTDGERVYAFFDSFGPLRLRHGRQAALGEGPRRQEDAQRVRRRLRRRCCTATASSSQWDHQGQSFITALDKLTGKELWRTKRQEIDSWGTPLVVEQDGGAQVIASAMNKVIAATTSRPARSSGKARA